MTERVGGQHQVLNDPAVYGTSAVLVPLEKGGYEGPSSKWQIPGGHRAQSKGKKGLHDDTGRQPKDEPAMQPVTLEGAVMHQDQGEQQSMEVEEKH